MRHVLIVWLAMLAVPGAARAQHGDTGFVHDKADQLFVEEALASGLFCASLWQLAEARTTTATALKVIAARRQSQMERNGALATMAAARGIHVASDLADTGYGPQWLEVRELDRERGLIALRSLLRRMQQTSLALFEHEAVSGLDAELRQWAADLLPVVKAEGRDREW